MNVRESSLGHITFKRPVWAKRSWFGITNLQIYNLHESLIASIPNKKNWRGMASLKHVAGWCAEAWPKWSAHALSFATCWMKAFVEGDEIRRPHLRVSESNYEAQRNLWTPLDSFLFSRFVIVVFLDVFFNSLLESSMTKRCINRDCSYLRTEKSSFRWMDLDALR